MDRVRRCCTGEMFQPTRLKGQLTPSCLVARGAAPCVRPGCFVFIPISFFPPRIAPGSIALIAPVFSFHLIFPAIRRVFRCHVRLTARPGNVRVTAVVKNGIYPRDEFLTDRGMRGGGCEMYDSGNILIRESQDISFSTVRFAAMVSKLFYLDF